MSLGRKLTRCDGRYSVKRTCIQKLMQHFVIASLSFASCFVIAWLSLTSIYFINFSSVLTLSRYDSSNLSHGIYSVLTFLSRLLIPDRSSRRIPLNLSWFRLACPLLFIARTTRSLIKFSFSILASFCAWMRRLREISVSFRCLFESNFYLRKTVSTSQSIEIDAERTSWLLILIAAYYINIV